MACDVGTDPRVGCRSSVTRRRNDPRLPNPANPVTHREPRHNPAHNLERIRAQFKKNTDSGDSIGTRPKFPREAHPRRDMGHHPPRHTIPMYRQTIGTHEQPSVDIPSTLTRRNREPRTLANLDHHRTP
jgi:hypothetical protein